MVSWVFNWAFGHIPKWSVDQLDIVLARGVALFLLPIHKSTCYLVSYMVRTLHALAKYTFGCDFYPTIIWYIWQRINWKKRFKLELSHTYTKHEYKPLIYSIVIKKTHNKWLELGVDRLSAWPIIAVDIKHFYDNRYRPFSKSMCR